jgi:hypothetical protein
VQQIIKVTLSTKQNSNYALALGSDDYDLGEVQEVQNNVIVTSVDLQLNR